MAKGENQKLKMLYLVKIFTEETDDDTKLTIHDIIDRLKAYEVNADRKTLYTDFEELRNYGLDIISEREGRDHYYYLGERDFELAELKILVDSVLSAKFITENKSRALISKLKALASHNQAQQLNRQVLISGRIKTINKSIYYNVDELHTAISKDRKITFHYFQWTSSKEMELRHDGALYTVSPWCLIWDDEYYYLVAYDDKDEIIKHYRVDKMLHINISDEPRGGREAFRNFDLPRYTKSLFGMFSGKQTPVTLEGTAEMAGVILDRFGTDIIMNPRADGGFVAIVDAAISPQFLGWIMSLGEGIKITAPPSVVEAMQEEVKRLQRQYLE